MGEDPGRGSTSKKREGGGPDPTGEERQDKHRQGTRSTEAVAKTDTTHKRQTPNRLPADSTIPKPDKSADHRRRQTRGRLSGFMGEELVDDAPVKWNHYG